VLLTSNCFYIDNIHIRDLANSIQNNQRLSDSLYKSQHQPPVSFRSSLSQDHSVFFPFLFFWVSCSSPVMAHERSMPRTDIENTAITGAFYQVAGANFSMTDTAYSGCGSSFDIAHASTCHVQGYITTTSTSSVGFEVWLLDVWYGRFVALGNSGLCGCMCERSCSC
jgi:hypothetical protein